MRFVYVEPFIYEPSGKTAIDAFAKIRMSSQGIDNVSIVSFNFLDNEYSVQVALEYAPQMPRNPARLCSIPSLSGVIAMSSGKGTSLKFCPPWRK
jgi:hypothetical protein